MSLADLALDTVVRRLLAAADDASKALRDEKDWKAFWSVEHDLVTMLHKLGVFGAPEKPIDPTEDLDQMRVEIQKLVDLEVKKAMRAREMLQVHQEGG